LSKRTIVLLAVLVVAVSLVAVLGGGWKWGDRKHATRIAGWAWGDDGSIVYDQTSPSTPPALPTQPAPQAQVENHG
jgi:hypothetical protein